MILAIITAAASATLVFILLAIAAVRARAEARDEVDARRRALDKFDKASADLKEAHRYNLDLKKALEQQKNANERLEILADERGKQLAHEQGSRQAELEAIKEALELERGRVDSLMVRFLPPIPLQTGGIIKKAERALFDPNEVVMPPPMVVDGPILKLDGTGTDWETAKKTILKALRGDGSGVAKRIIRQIVSCHNCGRVLDKEDAIEIMRDGRPAFACSPFCRDWGMDV